jgi:hypothetical protein
MRSTLSLPREPGSCSMHHQRELWTLASNKCLIEMLQLDRDWLNPPAPRSAPCRAASFESTRTARAPAASTLSPALAISSGVSAISGSGLVWLIKIKDRTLVILQLRQLEANAELLQLILDVIETAAIRRYRASSSHGMSHVAPGVPVSLMNAPDEAST